VPAGLGPLDDKRICAECDRLFGFVDAADLHPDLDPGALQPLDMACGRQRPEEDSERDLLLNEDGDVFIIDEVADQIDAEGPFCECLCLSNQIAQDVGRIDVGPDRAEPTGFADRGRESWTRDHRHACIDDRRCEPERPTNRCRKHSLCSLIR
jgi:hypothetical protein